MERLTKKIVAAHVEAVSKRTGMNLRLGQRNGCYYVDRYMPDSNALRSSTKGMTLREVQVYLDGLCDGICLN